ncbi:OmpP1/FadL family transporter [Hymenobacter sp. HDW8]|uniref:OmpP1/FadL family transporter n=1 Tax=Hymenobacter sp. HDW8 TaxID=2714932 RepID=UPI00140AFFE3|nr:hypothetical protein [Hymenobacter sp. HDW8]QIL76372.1 hypothetical protein G7064_11230 [Hymenobacter sp. HDW8]
MKNLKYWLGLTLMGWASHAFAQSETDALRYSQLQFGGTSRTLGIGGANVAVGADLGNLVSNPAGLGLFQQSEISFTPGLNIGNTTTSGIGAQLSDSRNGLQIGSLGAVFVNRRPDDDNTSDWRAGAFAVGLNRINDFNTSFRYSGTVQDNQSFFQRLREPRLLNGSLPQTLDDIINQDNTGNYLDLEGLAYGAYLTNIQDNGPGTAEQVVTVPRSGPITQQETVVNEGSQTQFDFGYGASYRDKIYIGGAIGIVSTRFIQTREFSEFGTDPGSGVSLTLRDNLETRGNGFNARLGGIYRPNDQVRVGLSVQTPTFMQLDDTYSTSLTTQFTPPVEFVNENGQVIDRISDGSASTSGEFSYRLTTPFRASGGVAVLVGKYGFLSGDLEYVNYPSARLRDDSDTGLSGSFSSQNDAITALYRSTVNVRIGGEARYNAFRFRLGYARYGSPYEGSGQDGSQNYFTGGLGIRQNRFFLDLAGVYNAGNQYYRAYTLNSGNEPVITVDANRFTTSITAGITF